MMDKPVKVEVILLAPVKIDGKLVVPDGKPVLVTPEARDEMIAAGAAIGDQVAFAPESVENARLDESAVRLGAALEQVSMLEGALIEANEKVKATSDTLFAAENEASALRSKLAALEAELAALKAQNTEAAKTTSKKVQAAKG